ncbi:hypothetical protein NVV95_04225 [Herbiconiux sp. CPCC 205716]|uniref:Uncharacterized protein n=1 Tax=Herbiconiux gentiana TaxID=2970912 RepID=A0ABT2GC48_9MICO|nr:hypothetical protein [Herbiconiux gentiana]MCS5713757.1 hypothetical protein [Herbiconiux gentiana]
MKRITYAGETVLTTDEVATALVELSAGLAKRGLAEAVTVPIVTASGQLGLSAELVVGVGNDVLAVPEVAQGDDPDFSTGAQTLRDHLAAVTPSRSKAVAVEQPEPGPADDLDLDLGAVGDLKSL